MIKRLIIESNEWFEEDKNTKRDITLIVVFLMLIFSQLVSFFLFAGIILTIVAWRMSWLFIQIREDYIKYKKK